VYIQRLTRKSKKAKGFSNSNSNYYWSSSTYKFRDYNAWIVDFLDGNVNSSPKDYSYYVRCVRAGE